MSRSGGLSTRIQIFPPPTQKRLSLWMLISHKKEQLHCSLPARWLLGQYFLLLWPCPNIAQDERNAVVSRKRSPAVSVGLFVSSQTSSRTKPAFCIFTTNIYIRLYHTRSSENFEKYGVSGTEDDHFESIAFYH